MASRFGFAKVGGYSNNNEGRMSDNRYSYNGRVDLKPADLFFWIAIDEIQRRVGFDDLAAASAMLLGQADVPAPGNSLRRPRAHRSPQLLRASCCRFR
nr:hypothetical protein [Burkholderia sp. BCC1998]